MKYYDNNDNLHDRIHTIRVTLQSGEYKGHIVFKVGGNCFGMDLLTWNPECETQEDVDRFVENDCNFRIDEEYNCYLYTLKDENGNECEFESDEDELKDNVVAIEIIDCVVNKDSSH